MWLARRWADPRMESCRCWDCGGGPASDGLLLTAFICESIVVLLGGVMARGIFVTGTDGITTFLVQLLLLLRFASPVTPGLSSPHHWANNHQLRFQGSAELSMLVHPLNWMSSRLFPLVARHLSGKLARETWPEMFQVGKSSTEYKVVSPPLVLMGPIGTNQLDFIYWPGSPKYLASEPLASSYYFFRM
ncbi:hypothetical protein BO79DRAFT_16422 [Aspergillus costaricaensis CBS 115574]|uniref:Uncharacterized protein n=1 Tax=Aspergillus costaricaensis CBS 115574 TaxID=1448317 RepID=A0ACD1IE28_9EURO|nr:hypothetical protein BO79DRAFT_16422 [Aspergillus costaricaensis CBS 115574]RAK88482.1 hypothetical protein BO79DRAFT_16422 [Aspergillus costaricaensis CBS 115574]